jgi:soluble lytic murein transglycosylase-like protein
MPITTIQARLAFGLLGAVLCAAQVANAGNQRYEPLAASVRAVLQASIADRASPKLGFLTLEQGDLWIAQMSARLARRMPDAQARYDFLITVQYESMRAGLDPELVLGVIDTESKFRKYAVSNAGARGYMQVMPFWIKLVGDPDHNLFSLRTNLRYGCVILRHYLDIERGDLRRALARYNGSLGKKGDYADKVVRAWQTRWAAAQARITRVDAAKPAPMRYLGTIE